MGRVHLLSNAARTTRRLPPVARALREIDGRRARVAEIEAQLTAAQARVAELEATLGAHALYPPGHFYSPVPNLDDVARRPDPQAQPGGGIDPQGVDLRIDEQVELLGRLAPELGDWPYTSSPTSPTGLRYAPDNDYFGHTDGKLWYGLLRLLKPRRVVEVGSGWSTALLLDTVARHGLDVELTCIEPFPDRLLSLTSADDRAGLTLVASGVQDLQPSPAGAAPWDELEAGDVLFIDSTHVAKYQSDVHTLFLRVLPTLRPGVWVHVHDIAFPFEYPRPWILEGRAWNEAYLLNAMLVETSRWEIALWPNLLWHRRPDAMSAALGPDTRIDGASFWMRRT